MHTFPDYVYQRLADHMRSWPPEIAHDICIIVCMIGFEEDDARRGTMWLGANTAEFWATTFTHDENDPDKKWYTVSVSPLKASEDICEGSGEWYGSDDPGDTECVALRDDYFRSLGIASDDKDAHFYVFVDACAYSIQKLFERGIIAEVCGKPVPVIFLIANDMGDENYLMRRMREVNPPGLTDEYYQWRKKHFSGMEKWD